MLPIEVVSVFVENCSPSALYLIGVCQIPLLEQISRKHFLECLKDYTTLQRLANIHHIKSSTFGGFLWKWDNEHLFDNSLEYIQKRYFACYGLLDKFGLDECITQNRLDFLDWYIRKEKLYTSKELMSFVLNHLDYTSERLQFVIDHKDWFETGDRDYSKMEDPYQDWSPSSIMLGNRLDILRDPKYCFWEKEEHYSLFFYAYHSLRGEQLEEFLSIPFCTPLSASSQEVREKLLCGAVEWSNLSLLKALKPTIEEMNILKDFLPRPSSPVGYKLCAYFASFGHCKATNLSLYYYLQGSGFKPEKSFFGEKDAEVSRFYLWKHMQLGTCQKVRKQKAFRWFYKALIADGELEMRLLQSYLQYMPQILKCGPVLGMLQKHFEQNNNKQGLTWLRTNYGGKHVYNGPEIPDRYENPRSDLYGQFFTFFGCAL